MRNIFIGLLLASSLSLTTHALEEAECSDRVFRPHKSYKAKLAKFSDGDTIHIEYGRRNRKKTYKVRFLSIDTPETWYQGKSQEYSDDAKDALKEMLGEVGDDVTIVTDSKACDPFGRVLGYVHNKEHDDVNHELLKKGLAINFCVYPTVKRCALYADAVAKAMKDRVGMFKDDSFDNYSSELDGDKNFKLPYDFRSEVNTRGNEADYVADIRALPFSERDKIAIPYRVFFLPGQEVKSPYIIVRD